MNEAADFKLAVRRGRRAATPMLVTHVVDGSGDQTSVGFVVSKAVGGAVVRNRVKRRLRHLMVDRLAAVSGRDVVVRALPAAAGASSAQLAVDLDRALAKSLAPR